MNSAQSVNISQDILWPRITIVTPSLNQGSFIEATLKSVLNQNYPNLEYIVIDGGSTDNTGTILSNYRSRLAYVVSEPDRGQAHAINKGFARATGDLVGWINSDDLLLPDALFAVAKCYLANSNSIILGDTIHFLDGTAIQFRSCQRGVCFKNMVTKWDGSKMTWDQPGTFVPRTLLGRTGPLDENLRFVFDIDWMCRLLQISEVSYLHIPVAKFRLHKDSKTVSKSREWFPELIVVTTRYGVLLPGFDPLYARAEMELAWDIMPQISLHCREIDRSSVLRLLMTLLRKDSRIIFTRRFVLACLLILCPRSILQVLMFVYPRLAKIT